VRKYTKLLNLGAGKKLRSDSINVDITPYPGIDMVVNAEGNSWPWKANSIDGIYVSHLLEHLKDPERFIKRCHRILKPGGFLRIAAPHSSCITSVGCMGHYRTYSYSTFDDYLAKPWYMFEKPLFKTEYQILRWWYEDIDAEGNMPKWTIPIIWAVDAVINCIIVLSPRLFENTLASFIQCREVIWQGRKI